MSTAPTHYDLLGCSSTATDTDLRRAYLRLARRHHPDFHSDSPDPVRREAENTMQRINEAWHVVGDSGRRREYDAALNGRGDGSGPGAGPGRPHAGWHAFDDGTEPFDPDVFDETPISDSGIPPWLAVMPILSLLAAALALAVALLLDERTLVVIAAVLAGIGLAGFIVVPLVALTRSRRGMRLD